MTVADPKPARPVRDPRVFTEFHRAGHLCVCCGSRHVTAAHLLSRGQGGDDVLANLVALCGSGSSGCHGAFDNGHSYRGDFGRTVTPAIVKDAVLRWLRSEAGEDARWYLTGRLGAGVDVWAGRRLGGTL